MSFSGPTRYARLRSASPQRGEAGGEESNLQKQIYTDTDDLCLLLLSRFQMYDSGRLISQRRMGPPHVVTLKPLPQPSAQVRYPCVLSQIDEVDLVSIQFLRYLFMLSCLSERLFEQACHVGAQLMGGFVDVEAGPYFGLELCQVQNRPIFPQTLEFV